MSKNVMQIATSACSGCSACASVCNFGALKIEIDNEGFYCAKIDASKCVECGMCQKVCPGFTGKNGKALYDGKAYAAQSSNAETIKNSSSGAIAAELSLWAIKQGYDVVGVFYDCQDHTAKFSIASSEEELNVFKGSKYLQANSDVVFKKIVDEVKKDHSKHYLVFGTPCQIFGLANILELYRVRDCFVLVDFFCHGVPSRLVWDSYLRANNLDKQRINHVSFRSKTIGWHNFVMTVDYSGGSYTKTSESDLFYKAFFDNVFFSKSCYECLPRMERSKADIRLGDFWGKKYQDREDGVSAVIAFTEIGNHLIKNLDSISVLEESSSEEICKAQSIHLYSEADLRKYAISYLKETNDLDAAIKKYRKLFPLKRRFKLFLKELTGAMPAGVRAEMRRVYRKISG